MNRRKTRIVAVTLLLSLPALAFAEDIDERAAADPDGHVHISNTAGSITVVGWESAEITVSGTLGKGTEGLEFSRDGRHTTIKVLYPDGSHRSQSSHLVVHAPEGSELSANGVATDIKVDGVTGVMRLQTISGDVTADAIGGDLEVKTVSGDMVVRGHEHESLLTITTVSGDADISDVAGELETTTVSGDIDIEAGTIVRARLRSTSGDIEMEGDLAADGRIDCESINGDVEVELEEATNINVDVETFSGDIENCFDVDVERVSQYGPGRLLRFSRGLADRTVRVKTLNGDVSICGET